MVVVLGVANLACDLRDTVRGSDGGIREELAKGMIARTTGARQMGVERDSVPA